MKVAIISGITGQDGAYLADLLLKKDYEVIGLLPAGRLLDTTRLEYLGIRDKVRLRKIDLLEETEVKRMLAETNPDEFYNLAAISSVGVSFTIPLITFDFNTRSVMVMLEAIRQVSPRTRFYQASTSEMFGRLAVSSLPIKESFLFHPVSPYGISKASAHWLTVNYREAYKLQTCCGILFNHESALRPPHFVVKKIIRTAIQIKNGTAKQLTLGNTSVVRDWGYAPRFVEAMWLMMQQETMADYLICSGQPTSLQSFVEKVFKNLGMDAAQYVKTDTTLLRRLELDEIYGDNSLAKSKLGWGYSMTTDQLVDQLIKDEQEFMKWEKLASRVAG
jgi:GDPmannose 4,6-dehydratase